MQGETLKAGTAGTPTTQSLSEKEIIARGRRNPGRTVAEKDARDVKRRQQ
jgi:hypothetical protein